MDSVPDSVGAHQPSFTVLVPARMASTRLPGKPLLDIDGLPMVVRVARQAQRSGAGRVVVATDAPEVAATCQAHDVPHVMTRSDHASGSDRLAEACEHLGLDGDQIIVNVQGDEPLIDPVLIDRCAALLDQHPDCLVGTVAHPIEELADWLNPNVVKVVLDAAGRALYFTRASVPFHRDGAPGELPHDPTPLRHLGLYAYRAGFLRRFPSMPQAPLERAEALEQLRVLWHGERIAVHITDTAPGIGVDTPEDLARVRTLLGGPSQTWR
ncbi:MAG: 3-deoxy-manno-octulosonate cytidylyltransferase [Betaproteobacteria bacterium]